MSIGCEWQDDFNDIDKIVSEETSSANDTIRHNKRDSDQILDDYVQKLIDELLNQTPEQMLIKMEYASLLSEYLRRFGREMDEDYSDIIPLEFEIFDGVDLKNKILRDALDKQISIEKSEYYLDILEGVRDDC